MTTLTQSDLDDLRRKARYGTRISTSETIYLLDHIAAQAAENEKLKTFARDTQVICDAQAAKIAELEERASDLQSILSDMEGAHERAQMAEIENAELKTDIASLESERDKLRKQGEGQFVAGMRGAVNVIKGIVIWDGPDADAQENAFNEASSAILSAASALEQKEQG